jgi:error-prone DNA polymerase
LVEERERGGPYRDVADLASRSGAGGDALERLAWAGACDGLEEGGRRAALWRLGITAAARAFEGRRQLALPLDVPEAPPLRPVDEWERLVADYGSTGMTLAEHPMELLRPGMAEGVVRSEELGRIADRLQVEVAGLVVARQRPATANGILFMLLEDEVGTVNLIVPPPVYARYRLAARTAPLLLARGRLERKGANINVVVASLEQLHRPDMPPAEVRHLEPPVRRETGRDVAAGREVGGARDVADLEAALPAVHSFGRRG